MTYAATAAAKSLQSCPTLCDPRDGSPPGSLAPGILQARTLEWVAISFSKAWKWKEKVKSLSRVRLLETPWTAAYQPPLSLGFSRQEYWSGVPLPSPDVTYRPSQEPLYWPCGLSTPGFPVLHYLLEFAHSCTLSRWPSIHLILCHLLLLPSIIPSIRIFSSESALCIRWLKYWSFSISSSNEYSELISFRIDWLDVLAVQGTLKSPLQHHSLKASILWDSDGQGSLACCSPWGRRELDMTERLNWTDSLLYGPTHTSVHDYCINHSFDNTDLCWQSDVSAF